MLCVPDTVKAQIEKRDAPKQIADRTAGERLILLGASRLARNS